MRLVFAGTPAAAIPTLQALLASQHEVVAVVTQPPAPAGRGRTLKQSEVHDFALANNLEVFTPESINSEESLTFLASLNADLAVVVAYGQLLKLETLDVLPRGWINLHFSLLPQFRGAAPVQRAIMTGEQITGASVFQLDAGMDTGPVYGTCTVEIASTDTTDSLLPRIAEVGAGLVVACVDGLETGQLVAKPQSVDDVSLAPKISVAETNIKWNHPALGIDRWIRGATSEPGAWTTCEGQRIGIGPLELADSGATLQPGELLIAKNEVLVGTGSSPVRLGQVKPAGKGWMQAADWARGLRTQPTFEYVNGDDESR